jgi:hypothetical protein
MISLPNERKLRPDARVRALAAYQDFPVSEKAPTRTPENVKTEYAKLRSFTVAENVIQRASLLTQTRWTGDAEVISSSAGLAPTIAYGAIPFPAYLILELRRYDDFPRPTSD